MSRKTTRLVSVLLGLTFFGCLNSLARSQQPAAGPAAAPDAVAVAQAESLSKAFRHASDAILPTVVKVKSTIESRRLSRRDGGRLDENPFRGTPFEDFFEDGFDFDQQIPRREGMGSGVIIDSSGLILTNNHVVSDADVITIELPDGREFRATDIRTDPQTDLAVLRIEGAGRLPAAQLGDSDALRIGDWVLAVGNPFDLAASVSAGIISAKGRSLGAAARASFLQTDAAINPGNSGGPLVNLRGEVVGINTAIASSSGGYQGIGFAIPINLAKWVSTQLVDRGKVRRAWLGIGINPVTQEIAESLGIDPRTRGVFVREVGRDTPAERAGVRPGDVITQFAGRAISSPAELQQAVERVPLGSKQELGVLRRGQNAQLVVTTEALPEDVSQAGIGRDPDDDTGPDDELGMRLQDLTPELADRLELRLSDQGVVVVQLTRTGVAYQSGLRQGMLITEVDGEAIDSVAAFDKIMQSKSLEKGVSLLVKVPGQGTRFVILRNR